MATSIRPQSACVAHWRTSTCRSTHFPTLRLNVFGKSRRWSEQETGRFFRTLKRGGALFPANPLGFTGHKEAETLGVTVSTTQVRSNGVQLAQAARLLDDGAVRIVVDSTFPLAAIFRARSSSRSHNQKNGFCVVGENEDR